jgi:NAD(P)-dependent dehydrogenase (short-subunit alcohol dehydrogenase family)
VLFARALAQRYPPTRLTSLAVHPGVVATSLFREFKPSAAQLPIPLPPIPLPPGGLGGPSFDSAVASAGKAILDNPAVGLVFKKPEDGCRTLVYALLAPGLPSGSYLSDMELTDVAPAAKDSAAADALWRWTEAWVGAKMSKAKLVSKAAVDPPAEGESWEPFLEQFRA